MDSDQKLDEEEKENLVGFFSLLLKIDRRNKMKTVNELNEATSAFDKTQPWSRVNFSLELSEADFAKVVAGFIPEQGVFERWEFIFHDYVLFVIRHGSDWPAYKLSFEKDGEKYIAKETHTGHEVVGKDPASQLFWHNYHSKTLLMLIESYLLGNKVYFLGSNAVDTTLKIDINGLHGINHWRRVCDVGMKLAKLNNADSLVIKHFAFLHDIAREDDFLDKEHGRRSAKFITNNKEVFNELDSHQLAQLIEAVKNHNSDGYKSDDITIQTCLDADRLDLPRVGVWVDADYLQTKEAKDYLVEQKTS